MKISISLFSFVLFACLSLSFEAAAQSQNPHSAYAVCHGSNPEPSCWYECGPNGIFCDFAGWECTWDDPNFIQIIDVKPNGDGTSTWSFEQDASGYLSDCHETRAINKSRLRAAEIAGGDLLLALGAQNVSTLSCVWRDQYCVELQDAYTCKVYGG